MPRGVPREKGAGRVDRASTIENNRQNIPSLVDYETVYADEKEAPVKKRGTGTVKATGANPVKTTSSAPETLSVAEKNAFDKFVQDNNIQGRFEAMDRSVNFPLGRG